jgi:hypothetical protein
MDASASTAKPAVRVVRVDEPRLTNKYTLAQCPRGWWASGGGYDIQTDGFVVASVPYPKVGLPTAWGVAGDAVDVSVFAVCQRFR